MDRISFQIVLYIIFWRLRCLPIILNPTLFCVELTLNTDSHAQAGMCGRVRAPKPQDIEQIYPLLCSHSLFTLIMLVVPVTQKG